MTEMKTTDLTQVRVIRRQAGTARLSVVAGVTVLGLAVLIGAVWLLASMTGAADGAESLDDTPQWAVVRREPIPITVVAEGDLMAKDQIDIINLIDHPDDEVIESIIEEGTWVEEGDWLYTLSAPGLVADRDEWESRVREAEAELEEAKRNLEIEKDTSASAEAKAKLDLELAELIRQQWELGEHPQKVRDLKLALEKATRELEQAARELAFSRELKAKEFISQSELEQDEITMIEAQNAMETAKQDIEIYQKYEKVKVEKEKLGDIEQAKGELARTLRKNQNKLELLEAKIISEQNELEQRQTRLADLNRMVGNLTIHTPREGMVMYASTIGAGWERWRTIRAGAGLRGGSRVMVISNTSQMVASLFVHESRINEINRGQVVSIRVAARPEEVFRAKIVRKKNSAVQSGNNNPHLRQYQVYAELPPALGEDIRPGMNCSGEIYIREIPEALAVPIQAVHTEGEDHFVYVEASAGKVRKQPIQMGGASDTLVQVKAGLNEGAKVLLRNPRPGELLRNAVAEPIQAVAAEPEPFPEPDTKWTSDDGGYDGPRKADSAGKVLQQKIQQRRTDRKPQRPLGGSPKPKKKPQKQS